MKKFISIILALILVLSLNITTVNAAYNETPIISNKLLTLTDTTLLNQNGVKIVAKGWDYTYDYEPQLYLYIENNTNYDLTVQVRNETVNGYMNDTICSGEVRAQRKLNHYIIFERYGTSGLASNGIKQINTIEFSFCVFYTSNCDTYFDSKIISLPDNTLVPSTTTPTNPTTPTVTTPSTSVTPTIPNTSTKPTKPSTSTNNTSNNNTGMFQYPYSSTPTPNVATPTVTSKKPTISYNVNGVQISIEELTHESYDNQPMLKVYIENYTDKTVTVQTRNEYLNGKMVDGIFSTDVKAGKRAEGYIKFWKMDLEKHGINFNNCYNIVLNFIVYPKGETSSYESPAISMMFN